MDNSVAISHKTENPSFKHAHMFNELAQALHKVGDDIEKSVGVFDSIGEKTETFSKLEESMLNPMESLITMQSISQEQIFEFVLKSFGEAFIKNKDNFNFIHYAFYDHKSISFFLSTKDDNTKEKFENLEYEFFIGNISNYLDLSLCFLESDMESSLVNTQKLEISK